MKENQTTKILDWSSALTSASSAILAVLGLIIGVFLNDKISTPIIVLLTATFVIAAFFSVYLQLYYRSKSVYYRSKSERADIKANSILEKTEIHNRADLLLKALGCLTDVGGEIRKVYKIFLEADEYPDELTKDLQKCKRIVLEKLCHLLGHDRRNYTGEMDYFKATLFIVESEDRLVRDSWWYPGVQKPQTQVIDRSENPDYRKSTAFRCLDNRNPIAIPNVPVEVDKDEPRWISLYNGQEKLYGSMLTVPIYVGEPGTNVPVAAILTIDTNRLEYFMDTKEYMNLWSNLLGPFWSHLSLLYEIEDYVRSTS